ncbi:ABC transporter permease [Enterococcus sp. BWM-S5]|uniref:ABC transporter permease n=1 Tax=Enterococcus larvae TaxID=2794352 RepID=A0ABS4CHV8_9ENTE|nr:ABC transporter permease [Enterococcus larvae]
MNFIKRALLSVARKKGKSIILFSVIFILGNVIAGAIAIQQSTQNVEKNVKSQLGGMATIELDYENNQDKFMEADLVIENLTEEKIKTIGESPYVKYYDYNSVSWAETKSLKTASMDEENMYGSSGFNLKGSNYPKILDVEEKNIKITDGTVFTQDDIDNGKNVALISTGVAEANGLSVGDQMIIDRVANDYTESGETKELFKMDIPVEIIGIFEPVTVEMKDSSDEDSNSMAMDQQQYMSMEQMNTIYLPNKVVIENDKAFSDKYMEESPTYAESMAESGLEEETYEYYTPVYVLNSVDDVEAFKEETEPLLPPLYAVKASTDQYDQIGGSMNSLSKISGYVVTIAVAAALLIISLVVLLFMRDRKHELGIYLSLGDKRGHVMGQIIIEMVLISGIALVLSLISGNFLGKIVSDSLLNSDILTTANDSMDMMYYAGSSLGVSDLTTADIMNSYKVEFSLGYVVTYLVVGLATTLLSAIVPLLYIVRLNPKKIMM